MTTTKRVTSSSEKRGTLSFARKCRLKNQGPSTFPGPKLKTELTLQYGTGGVKE